MIRKGLLLVVALSLSLPVFAQDGSVGLLIGMADYLEDGFDLDVGLDVQEIWYSKELEAGTSLRFKLGQADLDVEDENLSLPRGDHELEYGLLLVDYRFDEIWGSSTLFLGPGAYRQSINGADETNFGLSGGVTADFPVTRRLGLVLEGAYHWINFDDEYDFMTLGAGARFSF